MRKYNMRSMCYCFFHFPLLNTHSMSVSYLRVRCDLEAARCGTCCVTQSRWSLLFIKLKSSDSVISQSSTWIPQFKSALHSVDLLLKHVFFFCPQTDWCVADPIESNMKIGLSLATAAFLAALLSSIDAQGKWNHLSAVYLSLHYYHTLSL